MCNVVNHLLERYLLQEDHWLFQRNVRKPSTVQLTESWRKEFMCWGMIYLRTKRIPRQSLLVNDLWMNDLRKEMRYAITRD